MSQEQLQRSVFKWVQAADDEARGHAKAAKAHQTITAREVAKKYGVPEEKLRSYIRHEIEEEASCKALPFTMMMFMSYTCVVMWHDPVVPIISVEDSIMFDIEENANFAFTSPFIGHKAIYDVNSNADFWSWMIQGFIPLVLVQEKIFSEGRDLENDPEIAAAAEQLEREKRGYWMKFNKIVGGIRIRQERGAESICETMDVLRPFYNLPCIKADRAYELYPEKTEAKYTHDPEREFWLWPNDDLSTLIDILRQKEKDGWLDRQTSKIEITIPVYNGNLGVYCITYVDFFFSRGGHIWKRILPLSTYAQWWHGWWNVVPDVLWLISLLYILCTEVHSVCQTLTAKTGGGFSGIYYEYLSFWNIVAWNTVIFGIWIIVGLSVRFAKTADINHELVRLGQYHEVNQQVAWRLQARVFLDTLSNEVLAANDFRLVLGFYPLLIVMRLFEAFAHQPRLSIVTSTLGDASVDLLHFLLVFVSIFVTYAIMGVVLFGREIDNFTNLVRSILTCFRIMMGDFDWEELLLVGRLEAGFWFASFTIIIVLLMLNMLLAIVMEAYTEQKSKLGEKESLWEEFMQAITRWRLERQQQWRSLKEVSRAVRTIKEGQTFVRVTGLQPEKSEKSISTYATKSKNRTGFQSGPGMTKSVSNFFPMQEEYCLVTVDSLVDACPKMREEQAMELIEKAANDYYLSSRGDTNVEEMCHIIRKLNYTTQRLKRHMQKSLRQLERERQKQRLAGAKVKIGEVTDEGEGDFPVTVDQVMIGLESEGDDNRIVGFRSEGESQPKQASYAEMLTDCRTKLRLAKDWIGEEELEGVDIDYAKHPSAYITLINIEDAVEYSVKRVLDDEETVLAACRDAGIGAEKDKLRAAALGRFVRILQRDTIDKTVKCRVPEIGDVWFGLGALCQLKPIVVDDAKKRKEETFDEKTSDGISVSSETGLQHNEEVLRRIYDLETEKRIGQQTVSEAINAVSELKWQQLKEKTDRSKLQQKILGLRKKLVSRAREHHRLAQEASRQEERLNILSQSRDEYMELVRNLLEEQRKLQATLGVSQTLALEDGPVETGRERDVARSRERDLALEAMRTAPQREADRERRGHRSSHRAGSDHGSSAGGSDRGHRARHGYREDRRPRDDRNRSDRDRDQRHDRR